MHLYVDFLLIDVEAFGIIVNVCFFFSSLEVDLTHLSPEEKWRSVSSHNYSFWLQIRFHTLNHKSLVKLIMKPN